MWGLTWQRTAGVGQRKKTWVQRVIDSLGPRANLVRHMQITACFQVLVTDMTRLAFAGGIAYLSVHLDWYGKLVLGWELSLHPDTPLALASLQMAFAAISEWKGGTLQGLIVHQDQGSPSTSGDYVTAILESQAFVSYSRPATPGDNPVNESFFSRGRRRMGGASGRGKDLGGSAPIGQPGDCLLQHGEISYEYRVSNTRSVYPTVP